MIFYPVRNGRDFLFALHLLRVQGFFARKRISHAQAFTGLCSGLFVNSPYFSAHNTANTQAAYAPPAPRWRAYRQEPHLHRYQIPPTRRTPHKSAQPPIIIRYIRGAQTMPATASQLLPCADHWQVLTRCQQYRPGAPAEGSASPPAQGQPGGVSMLPTPWHLVSSQPGRGVILAHSTRRGSPATGARWAARNH